MVPVLFFGKSGTPGSVFARTVRKICTRGGESGKEIKAISCGLSAISCELSAVSYKLLAVSRQLTSDYVLSAAVRFRFLFPAFSRSS